MPENENPPADTDETQPEQPEGGEGEDSGEGGDAKPPATNRELLNAKNAAKRAAKDRDRLKAELAALKAELDKNAPPDTPVDPKAIAEAAKAEARAEVLRDRAMDKVELAAAKTFTNPELARRLLASNVDDFIDDGKVDMDAISEALSELLEANPYLAAGPEKKWKGGADQGPRNAKAPDIDALIAQAAAKGDVMEQIRLQNLKLLPHMKAMWGGVKP